MSFIDKIFGDPNEKIVKKLQPIVDKINGLEEKYQKFNKDDFKSATEKFKREIKNSADAEKKIDELLPEAFALVREASKRILGMRHFDVQLIGGIILHQGKIAEMKTGEGKTLVATLPLYLNALSGKGVQLVTVNDYLARLGAGWMAEVFHLLGMTTGVIVHDEALRYDPEYIDDSQYDKRLKNFRPVPRQEAYACDILYGTNNEYGFDYLRDNMAPSLSRMVQRDLYYAIVDEIDSILIDEARTPLIISAPAEESTDKYYKFAELVGRLKEGEDYNIDEKMKAATLTEAGITRMEGFLGVENIYTTGGIRDVHHIEQALKAHTLFKLDRDYVMKDGEVIIVDEFTGRLMHGRRYSEGLHQAIEAKEGVKIQRESQTLATITFQNFFRMYKKLSGMTGTAATEAEEFSKIYNLDTVIIPTHKKSARTDKNDLIYRTEEGKYNAVIEDVKTRSEAGQPVLVGTISIQKNEVLAGMMERKDLRPNVLNAKNHEKEARFIAEAGKPGAITIATNMAGRGVDIMLGGTAPDKDSPEYEAWQADHNKVISAGGLHVIGTERHESRRIDNQLRGRSGRQGDIGSSQFFVSMDDDLMRIFGGERMKKMMVTLNVPEDMPIENSLISRSIESAQRKVEGNNFDIRKHLVEYDDVINKHREGIYRKRRRILELSERLQGKNFVGDSDSLILNNQYPISNNESGSNNQNPDVQVASLSEIILKNIEDEIENVVGFHTSSEYIKDWNLEEIYQVVSTIFPVSDKLKGEMDKYKEENHKLDKANARTEIIEHLNTLAKNKYEEMSLRAKEAGINWTELEKSILIRSIDTLWIEHLEAMSSVRQGIGLRGYGQRDPLVEYKKEAFRLYNELNQLINKEVVYSIFKVGSFQQESALKQFSAPSLLDLAKNFVAPAKTANSNTSSFSGFKNGDSDSSGNAGAFNIPNPKVKDESGNKVGRNDACPCGSGKKYKKCCGN
ncbi:MAG: Protein translocase subunit SecA [Candidatus Falkowbacteria bacterium GW2011_GWC2_38_22]|uniref:Protein translocase subunit SecA n=1 Tax=Candidatus Falkowbacteria bacterium GW2011_GWE1_38_31 TaxID=1618638 RepID=A0A0G0JS31_9BACT|nr:MAG: Protein translocase subunit SecA [Candidatus Falkowbacteria bacterium GW2011_GWF2_38_1205]KKQ61513.1 MAG: Protein translocase subunit SecA [Candidatus Falkowbacteria bacterium GW2011_GWC2_38_22]KKQ63594.1 MAG: Protein translocase subunit SecA [Candidatus Falkowbacteria bacterium GW2011_GWF1_38_22]KKQ65746.1 MAG: Protein translocase subunit SecA [Candidatus Falkowbacteria bacterium GW2011_GWE2_38_254]KKQ70363.1 MAG: Protein translocase subunit SecA [Candidatus Falkowbacteria bacterium GW